MPDKIEKLTRSAHEATPETEAMGNMLIEAVQREINLRALLITATRRLRDQET